jgi:amino acid transporter
MWIFWITYVVVLIAYIAFNYFYIKKHKTLSKRLKLIVWVIHLSITFIALVIASILYTASLKGTIIVMLCAGIPSAAIAWTFTKMMLGLLLHKDIAYMSEGWPDGQIIRIANNKYLWLITEFIIIIVSQGLFRYIKRQKK